MSRIASRLLAGLLLAGMIGGVANATPMGIVPILPMQAAAAPPGIDIAGGVPPGLQAVLARLASGDTTSAIADTNAFIAHATAPLDVAKGYEVLGAAEYLAHAEPAAIAALKQAVALDPARSTAFIKLGSIALSDGDLTAAAGYFRQAIMLDPASRTARRRLAAVLQGQGDLAGAAAQFSGYLLRDPHADLDDKIDFANLLNQQRRFADAAAVLRPLLDDSVRDVPLLLTLGVADLGLGDARMAVSLLSRAQAIDPGNADVATVLGVAQRQAGLLAESAATLRRTVAARPTAGGQYQLGLTYLAQSDLKDARAAFAAAQALAPHATGVQQGIAATLLLGNTPDQGLAMLKSLAARPTARLEDFATLAAAYEAGGRGGEAEATYRAAVARFPKNPDAYRQSGANLALHQKYGDAAKVLAAGLALAPDNVALLRDMALVDERRGDDRGAIAAAERIAALAPDDPNASFLVAGLCQDSGDVPRAIALYKAIIAAHPAYPWAYNNLAALLTERGDTGAAVPLARQAVALAADSPATQDTLGWALVKSGRAADAVPPLQEASRLMPTDPEILYHLAVARQAAGDADQARQNASQALGLSATFKDAAAAKAIVARR